MKVMIEGLLITSKLETNQQSNKTFRILQIMQNDGEVAELVKIKDEDLDRPYEINAPIMLECDIQSWKMGDRSGISVKVIDVVKAMKAVSQKRSEA